MRKTARAPRLIFKKWLVLERRVKLYVHVRTQKLNSSPQDIADTVATHFASMSSDQNYDNHFLNQSQTESTGINFDTQDEFLAYNLSIGLTELHPAIQKHLKNASPGPDNKHASMLKNLHPKSLEYLFTLSNSILLQDPTQSYYKVLTRYLPTFMETCDHSSHPKTSQKPRSSWLIPACSID